MESIATTWDAFIDQAAARFRDASKDWARDFSSLRAVWDEIPQQPTSDSAGAERAKANSIRNQIRANCDITVIDFFSDAGFPPRYGFPIHLQRLSVRKPREDQPDKSTTAEGYRLERQSLLEPRPTEEFTISRRDCPVLREGPRAARALEKDPARGRRSSGSARLRLGVSRILASYPCGYLFH